MTPEEQLVYGLLMAHDIKPLEGCGKYIPVKRMEAETGIHWRSVQKKVECLVKTHKVPILHSTSAKDPGNKIASTDEEIAGERRKLNKRARRIFYRESCLAGISVEQAVHEFAQGELWKGEAA